MRSFKQLFRMEDTVEAMPSEELEKLCSTYTPFYKGVIPIPYWTAEVYGFGKLLRSYGYYPDFLPLCVFTDHSGGRTGGPLRIEIESDAPCQFFHSPRNVKAWKELSKKPCYVYYSPNVFYRRLNNIIQDSKAKGTIAFPGHLLDTTYDISDQYLYMQQLKDLPDLFQPVSICLHMHDINKGRHHIFLENGFDVYTAGHAYDYRFVERFYSIIRKFKFSTSNSIGSYTYYSVEMGIPFFTYGGRPIYVDHNLQPVISEVSRESYYAVHDIFVGPISSITDEQRNLVETDLGLRDGLSRARMSYVLYRSFFQWLSSEKGRFMDFLSKSFHL